ncbi:MAG: SEC-C domain-containing protein [Solirubrobacteraceae bacterium]|jgi:hypothetical protein
MSADLVVTTAITTPSDPTSEGGPIAARRGIRRLTGPVHARIVTDPEHYDGLRTINVGDPRSSRSAREVQTTARRLWSGYPGTEHTPVVVEAESGETIAFATIRRKPLGVEPRVDITAFGRDVAYRGVKLRDGVTSCGEIAVIAALDAIALAFGELMPRVWARVLPDNTASHRIFGNLNFILKGPWYESAGPNRVIVEDQLIQLLPAEEPLPWPLDPDVYVPPERPSTPFLIPLDPTKQFPSPPALGRNDLCWCGSGQKHKKCCLR